MMPTRTARRNPQNGFCCGAGPSFFFRRKSKDKKRLFFCERRLRNPHAPRFSGPKSFRVAVAQYLPSRGYRLVTGSLKVREFHPYLVDVGAIIFNMEIESSHDGAPHFWEHRSLSATDALHGQNISALRRRLTGTTQFT